MKEKRNFLNELNKEQKAAVLNVEGPSLVVAGAGSGKTKVLTSKLAYLVDQKKAWPNQILCVTFTNKAAKEMRDRVIKILGNKLNSMPWLGTFHSISVRFLRRHAEAVGIKSNFTILDTEDQKKLIKSISKAENIDAKKISPQFILSFIDKWKNKGLLPDEVKITKNNIFENQILKIYKIYQSKIKDLNSCDFGDLILYCVKLFENNHDIRKTYSENFKYILVDEYQDTNFIQNKWLNLIVNKNKNICCVGDDDQSIYSWRGAEIKNFLNFDKVYPNCKIFRLEQNYRSTKNILETASHLISNNTNRVGKKLWSSASQGELVKLNCYRTGKEEAQGISDIIEQKIKKKYSLNNVAILVRAIYQTREFEERFLQIGIGYRVLGGIKFYERAEIKDAVSYLRIINQKSENAEDRPEGEEKREAKRRRVPRKATPKRLERVALHYLERYSSSSENLRRVLMRRVERSARAHGTDRDAHPGHQPVLLTDAASNPNGAQIRFFVDGADPTGVDGYERAVVMFDGR